MLAMDMPGWASLCRLSSALLTGSESPAWLPFEHFSAETAGLICLTGGRRSLLNHLIGQRQERLTMEWLSRLGELFPERLYVELQVHSTADKRVVARLAGLAQQMRLPVLRPIQRPILLQSRQNWPDWRPPSGSIARWTRSARIICPHPVQTS